MNKVQSNDPHPVAVYDVAQKKCVMIFASVKLCMRVVLPDRKPNSSNVSAYIKRKTRCKKNAFGVDLALRTANAEQVKALDGKEGVWLDEKFAFVDRQAKSRAFKNGTAEWSGAT